jgi:spore coat polysaccharide biosynthesis protein SpsF
MSVRPARSDRPVVCITQARLGSSRLPGKILLLAAGRPLLYWHLSRLSRARQIDRLVVATTTERQDDPIVALGAELGIAVFRGSESDVLSRYGGAADASAAATIVRVTSDCPLIDPEIVDRAIVTYLAQRPAIDYLSIDVSDLPRGLDAEVFSRDALLASQSEGIEPHEREHVTPFIYGHPERFRCLKLQTNEQLGYLRWCVDEAGDYELVRRIIETLAPTKPDFGWRDCVAVMREHADWAELNRSVRQKVV